MTSDLTTDGLLETAGATMHDEKVMVRIPKLLHLSGLAASMGEATRKLAENAVSLNGEKSSAKTELLDKLGDKPTLRLGKRAVRVEWQR